MKLSKLEFLEQKFIKKMEVKDKEQELRKMELEVQKERLRIEEEKGCNVSSWN